MGAALVTNTGTTVLHEIKPVQARTQHCTVKPENLPTLPAEDKRASDKRPLTFPFSDLSKVMLWMRVSPEKYVPQKYI